MTVPPAPDPSWRFHLPPGWPQPPLGWTTPPGSWEADADWPPPPPDWQWWLPQAGPTGRTRSRRLARTIVLAVTGLVTVIVLGLVLAGRADLNRHAACVQVRAAYASSNAWGGGGASDAQFGASLAAIRTTDSSLQALISRAAAAQAKVVQSERNYDSTAQITQAEGEAWVPQNALLRACAP